MVVTKTFIVVLRLKNYIQEMHGIEIMIDSWPTPLSLVIKNTQTIMGAR